MLVFNALQGVLVAYVAWLAVTRMRAVQYELRIDARPLGRSVAARLRAGDTVSASAIVRAARPSGFSRVAAPLVAAQRAPDVEALVDEAWADLESDLERGVFALRSLASIAVAAGFGGAVFHLASFVGEGAVEPALQGRALEGAMGTMALGMLAAFPALSVHRILRRARVEVAADVDRAVGEIEAAAHGEVLAADVATEAVRNQRRRTLSHES